jgi:lipopolysaccharide/colanic/teichoic acid biosynthesis glycosyltransferase
MSVLKGDMSLIGPRPERPEIDKELKLKIPNYSLRYIIRPGLSGWAQVNFPYGASISDSIKKLSYDFYYLKHTSILLDFLICIRTIRMVFNARGAIPEK